MTKFSKGPWGIEDAYGGLDDWIFKLIYPAQPEGGFKADVATVSPSEKFGVSREESAANANLIAAGPDMYGALKKLEYWFDTDQEILDEMDADTLASHNQLLGMIRATLAKAEGLE